MSILAASVTACPDLSGKQVVLYGQTLNKKLFRILFLPGEEKIHLEFCFFKF
jgi:hypothetical protein